MAPITSVRRAERGRLAIGETVILLHPPLPLVGVSIDMARERQQNDSLADGYGRRAVGRVRLAVAVRAEVEVHRRQLLARGLAAR